MSARRRARSDAEVQQEQARRYLSGKKCCRGCGNDLVLSSFSVNKNHPDGLVECCKQCAAKQARLRRQKLKRRSKSEIEKERAKRLKLSASGSCVKTCWQCKKEKETAEFYEMASEPDGFRPSCRECDMKSLKQRRNKRTQVIKEHKSASACVNCGESDPELLNCAHLERSLKYRTASGKPVNIGSLTSLESILAELPVTKTLCYFCHRIETHKENVTEFGDVNTDQYRQRNKEHVRARKLEKGECVDCKRKVTVENCPAFDFDHLPMYNKVANLSRLASDRVPLFTLDDEIAKCALRCVNCHVKMTNIRKQVKASLEDIVNQIV